MNLKLLLNKPDNLKDLSGKVVVITGGNKGIGLETAIQLARLNATIVLACRNQISAKDAVERIASETNNRNIHILELDLKSMNSVKEFALRLIEKHPKIDILINNAGIYPKKASDYTADGFEECFQVNYLAHVYLISLLKDNFADRARIVCLSSFMHSYSPNLKSDSLQLNSLAENSTVAKFGARDNYCISKLAFIYLARYLHENREDNNGRKISIIAVNPGLVNTSITESRFQAFLGKYIFSDTEQGAYTPVYAAATEDGEKFSGLYLNNCKVSDSSLQSKNRSTFDNVIRFTLNSLKLDEIRL
ncbi:MAG: Retinol dehydrogenase 13 [Marteilia pararefringens]